MGNSKDMIFSFDQIILYVSKFITLKEGDYIFTGTPEGVGPTKINDHFEALWAGNYMHLKHPGKLQMAFGSYERDEEKGRKSFWIRKTK